MTMKCIFSLKILKFTKLFPSNITYVTFPNVTYYNNTHAKGQEYDGK